MTAVVAFLCTYGAVVAAESAVFERVAGGAYQPRALPETEIDEHLQAIESAKAALRQWRDEMQSGQAAEGAPRPPIAPSSTSATPR
jgi:hypothetical protein